ncbi:MAG: hypothetical protein CMJ40_07205 [Phycisphaerae bacterium]|nr:hypothetical protein [Phycisphaerae bacterium]
MVNRQFENRRFGFTLLELLVVIAIILIVSTLTLVSYRGIANDMRISAAVQEVGTILDQARARAIRDGRPTIVALRPRTTSGGQQIVEAVVGQASGETFRWYDGEFDGQGSPPRYPATRFLPIVGLEPRQIPEGMAFATPAHQFGDDEMYMTTGRVEVNGEAPGIVPAIMYGPDGEVVNYEQENDASFIFIDLNGDGGQRLNGSDYCNHESPAGFNPDPACPPDRRDFEPGFASPASCWVLNRRLPSGLPHPDEVVFDEDLPLCARQNDDEPFLVLATELILFDDRDARKQFTVGNWGDSKAGAAARGRDLGDYIKANGVRIRMNRYTGVSQLDR